MALLQQQYAELQRQMDEAGQQQARAIELEAAREYALLEVKLKLQTELAQVLVPTL
jgi:hypothetical protein